MMNVKSVLVPFLPVLLLAAGVTYGQEGTESSEEAQRPTAANAEEAPAVKPGSATPAQAGRIALNFSHADLVEVIHVLAQHLKLNYVIDPQVRGTVTIHSSEPLTTEDLLPIFHQILRMNAVVAVKTGDLYRIVPIKEGKGLVRPLAQEREDTYALQVVPVRFFSVAEMKRLLTPFLSPGGEILDYPRGNFLIMIDLSSNIRRLLEIKELIDVHVFAGVRMEIYQPRAATAEELAQEMGKVMQAYAASVTQAEGFAAQFLSIPRINRLLVISHSEAAWTYVRRWLERLDTLGEGPGRKIFVYPVQNGKSTELADILNQIYGTGAVPQRTAAPLLRDLHQTQPRRLQPPGPGALTPGTQGLAPDAQSPGPGAFAVARAPSAEPAPPARPRGARAAEAPSAAMRTEEQVRIVADPATNSLIIFATAQEYQNIKDVLGKLDIVPRQVLMEVLVAEVTLSDDLSFGVEYAIRRRGSAGDVNSALGGKGSLEGTLPSTFPTGLTSIISVGRDFRAVLNALMDDSRVKVLSHPVVLAADNRPARIQVGSEEPVATGSVVSTEAVTTSTTIQFRNVGRILTIIPQVNAEGLVHLQVKVEVSERGNLVTVGRDQFFSFDTRDAETTAVVQDGDTLVIGGIITDRKNRERVGIPFLMDVPVLGHFFGVTTDSLERTELIILITPHVIRNREEGDKVTEEFKKKLSAVTKELERIKKEEEKTDQEEPIAPPPPEGSMKPFSSQGHQSSLGEDFGSSKSFSAPWYSFPRKLRMPPAATGKNGKFEDDLRERDRD